MIDIRLTADEKEKLAGYLKDLKRIQKNAKAGPVSLKPMPPIVASVCTPKSEVTEPATLTVTLTDAEQEELGRVIGQLEDLQSGKTRHLPQPFNISARVCR